MITDPSWLYSTIAQSSAAIVAIIGGFITASVLYLSAEKRSLIRRLGEMKAQLSKLESIQLVRKDKLTEQEIQKREERSEAKLEEIIFVRKEISNIKSQLDAFSYPPNLGWGLLILMCFAFFSIVFPVMIIMYELFSPSMKVWTVILFLVGLGAVVTYIGLQIQELRRK